MAEDSIDQDINHVHIQVPMPPGYDELMLEIVYRFNKKKDRSIKLKVRRGDKIVLDHYEDFDSIESFWLIDQ